MSKTKAINSKEIIAIKGLTNEDVITDLLKKFCNENINKVKTIKTYDCNNEHTGIIVEARNKITDETESIIIDAVIGYPATEQVYETVYKKGSNCDKRIIIYTEGLAELDTYGGENDDAIKNLVEALNEYGTNIFLTRLEEGENKVPLEFTITTKPPEILYCKASNLPLEVKLKEEEFWEIYYWQQFEAFYYPYKSFTGSLHEPRNFGHVYGPDGAELYVKWTEEGLIFEAIDENEDSECLEPIWNNRKRELQALYPDAEMTFIMKPGKLPRLIIQMWPTPVQSLVYASMSEKKRLASEILEGFGKLIDFITSPLNDIDCGKIDEVQEAEQLVGAG